MKQCWDICPICGFKDTYRYIYMNKPRLEPRQHGSKSINIGIICKICNSFYIYTGPNIYGPKPKPVNLEIFNNLKKSKKGNIYLYLLGKINAAGEEMKIGVDP